MILTAVCILFGSLYFLQLLFMPKYMTDILEGSLIEEYYQEKTNHDLIFVGDCEVYGNISPITLWENYGITSFIRGTPQQLIWQSYYLLEETFKYEKPKVAVFNVLSMKYNEPQNEAYNRMTLDGMKMSSAKIKSIKASMTEDENLIEYIFPLLRYHSRWNEISSEDFNYIFKKDKISHNGYYMRVDIRPVDSIPRKKKLSDYSLGDNAYDYLNKMAKLCKENGVELVLIKSPSIYPHWYDEWDQQIWEFAQENNLTYINYLELMDQVGIDFKLDTYDSGQHLNLSGAEKFSNHLGGILKDSFDLKDRRDDEKLAEVWDDKVDFYYNMKDDQYKELEEYGYLKSFGGRPPQ